MAMASKPSNYGSFQAHDSYVRLDDKPAKAHAAKVNVAPKAQLATAVIYPHGRTIHNILMRALAVMPNHPKYGEDRDVDFTLDDD